MSDPLRLSTSVAGLITLSSAVYTKLDDFVNRVERAPKSTQDILHAVAEMRLALTSISELIDSFQKIPPRRKAMVQLDHLVICVSQAVITFTDLEMFLSSWPEISSMQNSAWKRIRWALQEDKANRLIKKLFENKTSLVLILSILQSESDFEAQVSNQALKEQMNRLIDENQKMRVLMNQIGDDIQTIAGSVKFYDDASSIQFPTSPITTRSAQTARLPSPLHSRNVSNSTNSEAPSEDPLSESPTSPQTLSSIPSRTEASSPPSLFSTTLRSPPRRSFSITLNSTWVYKRARHNSTDCSMTSSRLQSRAWSMFSGLSLDDVSVISFIELPLKLSDIPNDSWYRRINKGSLAYSMHLGYREKFIIAILGEPLSGKSTLVERICGYQHDSSLNSTIEDRHIITRTLHGHKYPIQIVDTAGLDCYEHLINEVISEADGFIITCPAVPSDPNVLQKLHQKIVDKNTNLSSTEKSPTAIVITKKDLLVTASNATIESCRSLAEKEEYEFYITSAKRYDKENEENIHNALQGVLRILVQNNAQIPRLKGWD